jgi:hypothetical protein
MREANLRKSPDNIAGRYIGPFGPGGTGTLDCAPAGKGLRIN